MTNAKTSKIDHTKVAYTSLNDAFAHFNKTLFKSSLPHCLITMQRHKGSRGYFSSNRFKANGRKVHEIAMNPMAFAGRTDKEILSTLVHEMVHLEQQTYGKPPGYAYHNAEWARFMEAIGLMPSVTGLPGAPKTGAQVTHYVIKAGKFDKEATGFLGKKKLALYQDVANPLAKVKAASKTKYTCEECELNAWAKPGANLMCGDCECSMTSEGHSDVAERKAA